MQIMFHLQKGLFLRANCQVHYLRNAFKYLINQLIQRHLQIHIIANARASLLLPPSHSQPIQNVLYGGSVNLFCKWLISLLDMILCNLLYNFFSNIALYYNLYIIFIYSNVYIEQLLVRSSYQTCADKDTLYSLTVQQVTFYYDCNCNNEKTVWLL